MKLNKDGKLTVESLELGDSDMQLLHSYFCHRQGYIPMSLMFTKHDGSPDHDQLGKLECLLQKLIDAVGHDIFDEFETDQI